MIKEAQDLGAGLWYLPEVFDTATYRQIRRCYRETATAWQCLSPNRLMSIPNNPDYPLLKELAEKMCPEISSITGQSLKPHDQTIFVDLPGHQLTWHFDSQNYRVLLQVYCGDLAHSGMGTQWYLGSANQQLLERYGTDTIVDVSGLEIIETPYAPNAGYINDNTLKKVHGTRRVPPGTSRESVLFTFL